MNTKLALFSHHYVDGVIYDRYYNLKKLNPSWDIKPIGFEEYDLLPDSVVVNKDKYPTNNLLKDYSIQKSADWCDPDLYLYDAYLQYPHYDAYFLYEYDTICNVSIDDFFDTSLDFFGNNIVVPGDESWWWVEKYRQLNPHHKTFDKLYAYGQSTCIYMTNNIIKRCVEEVIKNKHLYCEMLSEIRGGTLVSQVTELKRGRNDIRDYISWTIDEIKVDYNKKYFFHPIK
jgi:hypothetical protein